MNAELVKRTLLVCVLLLFVCAMLGSETASAAETKSNVSGDKDLANKKGLAALDGDPAQKDKKSKVTGTQIGMAVGSCIVMFAVVRFV